MKKLGLVVLSVGLMVGTVSFSALACSPGPENSYTPNARYSYQYETQYAPNAHYPYQYQTQNDPNACYFFGHENVKYEWRNDPRPEFRNQREPNYFFGQPNRPVDQQDQFTNGHKDFRNDAQQPGGRGHNPNWNQQPWN